MTRDVPSAAEALGRAHKALLNDLQKLQEAAAASAKVSDLRDRLQATRRHITEHFRFEEQNGYLDAVRKREPRLDRVINELAQEHRQLAQSLDGLIAEAQSASVAAPAFCAQVRDWVDSVRQHETRENDLVLDAFNQDLSAED
jgi:hemerythrin-like domain-containing protein